MEQIERWVADLVSKDDTIASAAMKGLLVESERSNQVYLYFDRFVAFLDSVNGYHRIRGIFLIGANAKWDVDFKVDEMISRYLRLTMDEKPSVSRLCIQGLPQIAKAKPELVGEILQALRRVNPLRYKDTMSPLIQKDVAKASELIERLKR